MNRAVSLLVVLNACAWSGIAGAASVTGLRCEYRKEPLGLDVASPCLSWMMNSGRRGDFQSTYQVLVARSPEKLSLGQGDLWGQCLPEANSINAGCWQQDEHTFFARLCARFDSVCSRVPWWGGPGFVLVAVTATI
jgi:hypothetical protein